MKKKSISKTTICVYFDKTYQQGSVTFLKYTVIIRSFQASIYKYYTVGSIYDNDICYPSFPLLKILIKTK